MFVQVPVLIHSMFYINNLCDNNNDTEDYLRTKFLKTRENPNRHNVGGIPGAYTRANPQFGFLHPLHVHNFEKDYGRISIKNVRSKLKRNRRMKEAWYTGWAFRDENESWEDYQKRCKAESRKTKVITYGSADSVEQIFKRFEFLNRIPDRYFYIDLARIDKAAEPEWGGFRQHKNGPYIGNKEMQFEYFGQEGPEFEYIITYHIYEVKFEPDDKIVETEHFKFAITRDNKNGFHAMIFDKNTEELMCYAFNENRGSRDILGVGDGSKTLFTVDGKASLEDIDALLWKLVQEQLNETV